MRWSLGLWLGLQLGAGLATAQAQAGPGAGDRVPPLEVEPVPSSPRPPRGEGRVLAKLYRLGLLEAAAGRLAMEKGSTRFVREYGARLVRDHQLTSQGLLAHAARLGVDVSQAGPETAAEAAQERAHQQAIENLRDLAGREFDLALAREMQASHLEALTLVADARHRPADDELQAWLGERLGTLRTHEQMATNIMAASADRRPIID